MLFLNLKLQKILKLIYTFFLNEKTSFGSWGSNDGQFKGIEGLSVDELGDIYVCDRENNRIQVF